MVVVWRRRRSRSNERIITLVSWQARATISADPVGAGTATEEATHRCTNGSAQIHANGIDDPCGTRDW